MLDKNDASVVKVVIAGCGGAGINLTRAFVPPKKENESDRDPHHKVLFFDTSVTNGRGNERIHVLASGSGSGSRRVENAREIEAAISNLGNEDIGECDVFVAVFSLGGGSGSVIGPLLMREQARLGRRVIGVAVVDTSFSVGAVNNLNTLKTLTAIATNNDVYMPLILVSNDQVTARKEADDAARLTLLDLVEILTKSVHEVDRNDRLNWINSSSVTGAKPGLKLMSFISDTSEHAKAALVGVESEAMVDSMLVLQNPEDSSDLNREVHPTRLKKVGMYIAQNRRIVGMVSGDIGPIDAIIDKVEKMASQERAQKNKDLGRLSVSSGGDDLIL